MRKTKTNIICTINYYNCQLIAIVEQNLLKCLKRATVNSFGESF